MKGVYPHKLRHPREIRNCLVCGKDMVCKKFTPKKFCSHKCAADALRHESRYCLDCGVKVSYKSKARCYKCAPKHQPSPRTLNIKCLNCNILFKAKACVVEKGKSKFCSKKCYSKSQTKLQGIKTNAYKVDRTTLAKKQERNDSSYQEWRRRIWLRDSYACKIANPDCKGRIEVHHILAWRDYLELRYEINNGITLCHAHHPRVRAEEKRLISTFMELVSVSKY